MNTKSQWKEISDENLLQLYAKDKNKEALEVLLERHMRSAYYLAFRYMRNQADAEDMVQKAFINVMRFSGTQNQQGMVKAWIMKIVLNTCKNEIKHLILQRKLLHDKHAQQTSEQKLQEDDSHELRNKLITAIEQLPEHFRWPIWLTHYEDMSIKEVAHCLGKPEDTIRKQIARGLQKLEQHLVGFANINTMNIIALLSELKNFDQVPETLISKIQVLTNIKLSTRLTSITAKQNTLFLYSLLPILMVVLTITLGFFWWTSNKNKDNDKTSLPSALQKTATIQEENNQITNDEKLNLAYDFSSAEIPNWCTILKGNTQIFKEGRESYLKVLDGNDFIMQLNIPLQKNTFKVSYDLKLNPVKNSTARIIALSAMYGKDILTFGFNDFLMVNTWYHVEIYVQKNIEAVYYNGKLKILVVSKSEFTHPLCIHLQGAFYSLDNIKVKNISEKAQNEFTECIKIANQLLENKGPHRIKIPSPLPKITKGQIPVSWGLDEK